MRVPRKTPVLTVAAVALSLSGCTAWTVLTGASISPTQVYIAANAFDAVEATGTNYLRLPACANGGPVLCRTNSVAVVIAKAVRSGRAARDQLEAQVTSGGSLATPQSISLYQALTGSTGTLQTIITQYGIK